MINYLEKSEEWTRKIRQDFWIVYTGHEDQMGEPFEIVLPPNKTTRTKDHPLYIATNINLLAGIEGVPVSRIVSRINGTKYQYRLLEWNERISANDEVLLKDCMTWEKIGDSWISLGGNPLHQLAGKKYDSHWHNPIRRKIID